MAELNTVVRAAGGVVWRPAGDEREIALVHRPRYEDWSLPKGKLDPGEHPLTAAVREVYEETLVHGVPTARLPSIRYLTGEPGVEKLVDFWSMRAESWTDRPADDEIAEVRWVPAGEADELLSYKHDRGVVRTFRALPRLTGVVLFVRHAKAGKRDDWAGVDVARPLDPEGVEAARSLSALLRLFRPERVLSATPLRCQLTVAPVGLPVQDDPAFDEGAAVDGAVRRLRELAGAGGASVVCSQGKLMPPVLAQLTGRTNDFTTPKGTAWVLTFAADRVVGIEHLDPAGA